MANDEYNQGKEDALRGGNASRFTDEYINGYFNGLRKNNPLLERLDKDLFRDGYLNRNSESQQTPSYLAGRMVREMAVTASELEKKVETAKTSLPQCSNDPELDRINNERFEYDLPPLTKEDVRERLREEMWETYGYDIEK